MAERPTHWPPCGVEDERPTDSKEVEDWWKCESEHLRLLEAAEPVLRASHRFALFPVDYPDLFQMGKKAIACFWTVEEVDLSADAAHLSALTRSEVKVIKRVLAFFAGADTLVMDNLQQNVLGAVSLPEASYFFAFQAATEAIHSEMYSLLVDCYASDAAEKATLFSAVTAIPSVTAKAKFCTRWIGAKDASFAERLFAFACVEAVFFSTSFAVIFYFRSRNLLPGLSQSNDLISRDEGLHVAFAGALFSKLKNRPSARLIHAIAREATRAEEQFIDDSLPDDVIGLSPHDMRTHAHSVADYVLDLFGYPRLYDAASPLSFMKVQQLENKANFFERRATEYARFSKTAFVLSDEF
jgi:ribonucleotide reductase beta subunit family protein with ferritin-like domain